MRLPRLRFTLRRMMVGVALAAVLIISARAIWVWTERRPGYLRQSLFEKGREKSLRGAAAAEAAEELKYREDAAYGRSKGAHDYASDLDRFADRHRDSSAEVTRRAEEAAERSMKWERAYRLPWATPPPDRPPPSGPRSRLPRLN